MVEETMSNVSGVLGGGGIHNNRRYSGSDGLHDGGVNRPVVEQPTKTRSVLFLSGIGKLLPECSEGLTSEIPHAIRNFVCRVYNRRQKAFAPPL